MSPDGGATGGGGGGGAGGGEPCGMDCSKLETAQCTVAVCNTGQLVGPLNTCIVVPAPTGTACDDGLFCTVGETCDNGICGGGTPNPCGVKPSPCLSSICYEETKSCDSTPVNDGAACTPKDLCQVDGVCHIGDCVGHPKDCSFSPLSECNKVACEQATGKCVGTADPDKDDAPCVLTGDVCRSNKTCKTGQCGGGTPKDCSALDVGCQIGVCDGMTGLCDPAPAPIGTSCSEGIPECHVGKCDEKGLCTPFQAIDGATCNDHDACTKADICGGGVCGGSPVSGCVLYFKEGFESCPHGWTFGGDWQCGPPADTSPVKPHTGSGVIATQLSGLYHVNQSFNTAVADSPSINLTSATSPVLSFWAWEYTEGSTFDGWNLKVSTDNGATFMQATMVSPTYNLSILGQPAWGGNHSLEGWKNYIVDLSPYKGHPVILRFAFRSDGATVYPGVYLDDIVVAEPQQIPLDIASTSPLPDVYTGMDYATQLIKTGGSSNVVWSIKPGGVNTAWLGIDAATGVLKGAPSPTQTGPVTVTVHVEEQMLPSNYAEKTFTFNVIHDTYYTSFEGACPNGWTLIGDWECGVPSMVGPPTAYAGTKCIATQIAGPYHDLLPWGSATATSPDINLAGVPNPTLTFRMWVNTEGVTYDGFNMQVSSDGGQTYTIHTAVTPTYPLMVGGKPAWGGDQTALGWQLVTADLAAYAGQTIRVRFSFRSDSSGNAAGVYIDDFFVQ